MAEILQHKTGLFGSTVELQMSPDGLTLTGMTGPGSVEYAPISDVSDVGVERRGRKSNLHVNFGGKRPSWVMTGIPTDSAEWAAAVIAEGKSVVDKLGKAEYTRLLPFESMQATAAGMAAQRDGHAAVDLVDFFLMQGALHGASDVHFDPYSDSVIVRFRVDGILRDAATLASGLKRRLTARLKVVSRLATYKKSVAQEGRAAARLGDRTIDFRFSSIPTIHGEKVAVRVFDPAKSNYTIDRLGMSAEMLAAFQDTLLRPQGTVLLTGPSSSGKTTTMYAALGFLHENRKNLASIATVEDPVELDLRTVNQTQVNTASGLTFASALRTVLRQDPEVIMIGEIRDAETAEIAVQAGLTGHMRLSTVHARSAAGVLLRLLELGVEPYLLASSVSAVLSQRLVRTVQVTDYSGRTGVFEFLPITDAMRELVLRRVSLAELEQQVQREGVRTLHDDGRDKVQAGITTQEELDRVLG